MVYRGIKKIIIFLLVTCFMMISVTTYAETNEEIETTKKYLGKLTYAGTSGDYSSKKDLGKNNPHFGWELGQFYISGFTRVADESDSPTVLKNVGDKVKLTFVLNQDINKLNGKNGIKIAADKDGYDEDYGVKKSDFGKGMLIVKHTDYEGKSKDPVLYKNFLNGVKVGADTEVELFEEGDYEVALDYEVDIEKSFLDYVQFWNSYKFYYRISFKFSVRNGNCMVYPREVETNTELTNTAVTEKGFYLDFAKSRYLDVNIKKEVLNDGGTSLVEDTRFNKPAKDGEQFTDEGVYTITAFNRYTKQTTEKIIYVGSDEILKAYATNGLTISEIHKQIDNGALITEEGKLDYTSVNNSAENVNSENNTNKNKTMSIKKVVFTLLLVGIIVIVIIIGVVIFVCAKKKTLNCMDNDLELDEETEE